MSILITGGAGYIGSHTLIELSHAGYDFIVYDHLSNSSKESLKRVSKIINKDITFISKRLKEIFTYIGDKEQYQLQIIEFNHDEDHLHILY